MEDLRHDLERISDLHEVCEVTRTFKAWRDGQEVTVEVLDAGPEAGNLRYRVTAHGSRGSVTGNPDGTVEGALAAVHWDQLD